MPNTIRLKRSSVPGKAPASTDLQLGEIAINTADGKVYTKRNDGGGDAIVDLSGSVTSVATGPGLTGGPITTSGTISLADTAVTPGSYTNASITVDAQGRITAASNGSGGSGGAVNARRYVLDDIAAGFNGTTTTFALTYNSGTAFTPADVLSLEVILGGIQQRPGVDYSVGSSSIVFALAPAAGLTCTIIGTLYATPTYVEYATPGTYTWTKPSDCTTVYVELVSGGGGGGGGRRDAAGTGRCGGGGGASGRWARRFMAAADVPSTVTVTVGSGGSGGSAGVNDSTNGSSGGNGGSSSFGTLVGAVGGNGGGGGTATAGNNGALSFGSGTVGGNGGSSSNSANAGSGSTSLFGPGGGGAGGGLSTANAVFVSGNGGLGLAAQRFNTAGSTAGGASGGLGGSQGGSGTAGTGDGGGGGGASTTANGGNGGSGAFPGGGGGGGGAAANGFPAGAGGRGGDGVVRVWTW